MLEIKYHSFPPSGTVNLKQGFVIQISYGAFSIQIIAANRHISIGQKNQAVIQEIAPVVKCLL